MKRRKIKVKPAACKKSSEHFPEKQKPYPLWKRISKGISELIENHDIVERDARDEIVGYLYKTLRPKKRRNKRKKIVSRSRRSGK
jgi:hypothetical protein